MTNTASQGSRAASTHFSSRRFLDRPLPEAPRPAVDPRLVERLNRVAHVSEILLILGGNLNREAGR